MILSLSFGTKSQVRFDSYDEFFRTLGFLAGSRHTDIHIEHNEEQGAWSYEGRIHCYGSIEIFPTSLRNAATKGTGNITFRINCNEYVEYIIRNYGFIEGKSQHTDSILSMVPPEYIEAFNEGLNL